MSDRFYTIMIPEVGEPVVHHFEALDGLADFLRIMPKTARAFHFKGEPIYVTAAPWRYLIDGEQSVPLFDPPTVGKIDKSGYVGCEEEFSQASSDYNALMKSIPAEELADSDDDSDDIA